MAKPKVIVKIDAFKDINDALNKRVMQQMGNMIVDEMKVNIAAGLSPVKGVGRFEAYASQRENNPDKYPNESLRQKTGKKKRPVNLKLWGGYLENIISKPLGNGQLAITFKDFTGKIKDLYEAHNLGTLTKKNVPQRKHIPSESGDQFNQNISQKILEFIGNAVDNAIKKSNK